MCWVSRPERLSMKCLSFPIHEVGLEMQDFLVKLVF